jgi:hypothetical protein
MSQGKLGPRIVLISCLMFAIAAPIGGVAAPASGEPQVEPVWMSQYDGGGRWDNPTALAVSPDGTTVYVTGSSDDGPSLYDAATIAYDAETGSQRWEARYNGPANNNDYGNDLVLSPDGSRAFITGGTSTGIRDDFATVAYDSATGDQLWSALYGSPTTYDDGYAIGVSPDGDTVFVAGYVSGVYAYAALVAYDAVTGAQLWEQRLNGSLGDLGVNPDGTTVYIGGSSLTADFLVAAYDATSGAPVFLAQTDFDQSPDYGSRMSLGSDGTRVYLTGITYPLTGGSDIGTVAYDAATGVQLWKATLGGPGAFSTDYPGGITAAPDGTTVYVAGAYKVVSHCTDFVTAAYDSMDGTALWAQTRSGPRGGCDTAYSVGVSPDGARVYTVGAMGTLHGALLGTVANDAATGEVLWFTAIGPGHGYSYATAVGVSPDSASVYVTASLWVELDGRTDYVTISYPG